MVKILITSVGSLVGQNVLDSLQDRRADVEVVGVNSLASAAGNFRCDRCYLAPSAAIFDAYRDRLHSILCEERPDLVLPGRDDDVVVLAAIKEAAPSFFAAIPVGPLSIAKVLADKWASHEFAAVHGLPYVDTALADDLPAVRRIVSRHGFPLIAKPRRGNGSRGTRVVFDDAQCAAVGKLDGYVLQHYVQPEPEVLRSRQGDGTGVPLFYAPVLQQIVSQAVIGPDGRVRELFCTFIDLVMGRAERIVWLDDAEVMEATCRYAEAVAAAGWVGALNVQGRRDKEGAFLVYELNGRVSGGTMARLLLGFDEVGMLFESFTGRTIPPSSRGIGAHGIVTKSLVDFTAEPNNIADLQNLGKWQRVQSSGART